MPSKYTVYRVLYPFRVRRQSALRSTRLEVSVGDFEREMGSGKVRSVASAYLWERLRECAFVPDFRPSAADNLGDVLALSAESVRDEVVAGLVDHLGLHTEHINFSNFSFSSLQCPRDIADFVERVANMQDQPRGTRFV